MNVMTVSPVTPNPMKQNEEQRVGEEGVDIPRQPGAGPNAEPQGEGSPEENEESAETEPVGEAVEEKESIEDKDGKKAAAKPRRKSATRNAAGTKPLIAMKDGRAQY